MKKRLLIAGTSIAALLILSHSQKNSLDYSPVSVSPSSSQVSANSDSSESSEQAPTVADVEVIENAVDQRTPSLQQALGLDKTQIVALEQAIERHRAGLKDVLESHRQVLSRLDSDLREVLDEQQYQAFKRMMPKDQLKGGLSGSGSNNRYRRVASHVALTR